MTAVRVNRVERILDDVAFVLGGVLPFCLAIAVVGFFLPPPFVEVEWMKLFVTTGCIVACLFALMFRPVTSTFPAEFSGFLETLPVAVVFGVIVFCLAIAVRLLSALWFAVRWLAG